MPSVKSIFPSGEHLRQAVHWISEMHRYDLEAIEEACQRYDLTPGEEEFIFNHFLHADRRDKA